MKNDALKYAWYEKLWDRLFGDMAGFIRLVLLLQLAWLVPAMYVLVHFIKKYW